MTTTGQFGTDKLPTIGLNQKATTDDYLKQVADTIAQTVMQSGVMAGGTTGVSTAVRYLRDKSENGNVAAIHAEDTRQRVLDRWNQGLLGVPREQATQTPDGRIEATPAASTPPAPAAAAEPSPIDVHPSVKAADSIVAQMAETAGVPLEAVLPLDKGSPSVLDESTVADQDVMHLADARRRQLIAKRDGQIVQVPTQSGLMDQEIPAEALTSAEAAELQAIESGNPQQIKAHYGLTMFPSEQAANQSFAQTAAPVAAPANEPAPGTIVPQATEPGLVAAQENQNAQDFIEATPNGSAPSPYASQPTGRPVGATAEPQPADQAAAAQANPVQPVGVAEQQVQPEAQVTFDVSDRNEQQLRYLAEHGQPGWKEAARSALSDMGAVSEPQGQFKTSGEAQAYISAQRRASSAKLPKALPLQLPDGSFGVVTEGHVGWNQAVAQAKANAPKTEKEAKAKRAQAKAEPQKTKPKTEKALKARRAIKFGTPVIDPVTVSTPYGDMTVAMTYAINPDSYADIYGKTGGMASFELHGAGVDSYSDYKSVAGVPYQGEMTESLAREMIAAVAEKNQRTKPKDIQPKERTNGTKAEKTVTPEPGQQAEVSVSKQGVTPTKREFTYAIKPTDGGFLIESDNGGGVVMAGRPNGPGAMNTVPAKVFKTESAAREYMQNNGMAETRSEEAAPGTRVNGEAERAAADRLEELYEQMANITERNSREGNAKAAVRSMIEELRKPKTVTSVEAILEKASSDLTKSYGAFADVIDNVVEGLQGQNDELDAEMRAYEAKAKQATEISIQPAAQEEASGITRAIESAKRRLRETRSELEKVSGGVSASSQMKAAELRSKENAIEREISELRRKAASEPEAKPLANAVQQQFAGNKLFTSDAVEKARARMKSKLGTLNSGIDPEMLQDGMTIAGAYIESGVRKYSDYAKAMVADFGEKIRPYLRSFYEAVRHYPGLDTAGMTTAAEIDLMEKQGTAEHMKPAPGTEAAIGEKMTVKRTKERKASGGVTLVKDYGVSHIDGYTPITGGKNEETEEGLRGGVKDQFLKDATKYMVDVEKSLSARGFVTHPGIKKAGNVNRSGVAGSGEVSLTMFHPDMQHGIYLHVGDTSLRGAVPVTKYGVAIMARVSTEQDKYGNKDMNRWMPVDLTSAELSENLASLVEKIASTNLEKSRISAQNENVTKDNDNGNAQRSDNRTGQRPVEPAAEERSAAVGDERVAVDLVGGVAEQVPQAGTNGQPSANAAKPETVATPVQRVPGRSGADAREPRGKDGNGRTAAGAVTPTGQPVGGKFQNFTITDELNFAGLGAKAKYSNNVAAIRLIKQLDQEGRQATPDEQKVLAKYIGWGGMPQVFDPNNEKFRKEFDELKALLTPEEHATAASSTRNAHYTAEPVVSAMWSGLRRIGFTGGKVIEPSMGSGNFFGLMPVDLRNQSSLFGVEFDHLTGAIAKQLYPNADIHAPMGFQDIKLTPGSFKVAAGNPPFGSEQLYDKNHPDISKFKIHGFFFAKSMESLEPGGVLAMVVSKGLLDANDAQGKAARNWLADRSRLLGAIRLPNSAFQENANTEVTTDIVFLQKLGNGIEQNKSEWTDIAYLQDRETGEPIGVNRYFADHPDMMLGEMTLAGSMYRANEPTLSARPGDNLGELLMQAIGKLPENVLKTGHSNFIEADKAAEKRDVADVREYGFYLQDGKLFQRMPDDNGTRQAVPVERKGRELERVSGMIELRDLVRQQLALEKSDESTDKAIEAHRAKLNKAYDAFVKKNGYLNGQTNKRLFQDDSDFALVMSLETKYDKGVSETVAKSSGQKPRQATAQKATIFSKRVQTPVATVAKVKTAQEAMVASLNERGRIDPEYMARVYGKEFSEIVAELGDSAFESPDAGWQPSDLYLSGNVKQALQRARDAAQTDSRFERNVAALLKVQPADINPSDIFVKIGSPWVSVEDYNEFAQAMYGGTITGTFMPSIGAWSIKATPGKNTETHTKYGTERFGAHAIMEYLMSNRQIAVYDTIKGADGKDLRALNADDTAAAQGKADELAEAFQEWIWQDNERRERLSRAYNDTYNTNVKRAYDGSHLTLPGMNQAITLRPHQLNWVYRSLVEGVGLADHVVGAGKTFAMIASAMEMRRLGLSNKPMIVVPNHLVGQWSKDILTLYPGANVLAASRKDFAKDRRKLLFSKIATGDWDMVVVAHSSFGRIPVPAETEKAILDDQLKELVSAIESAKKDKGARFTVKDLERAKVRIEEKLKKLADRKQDDLLDFSDLGVDALMVDEAHEFKNLFFTTSLQGVAGLGSPAGSTRAFDMFVKTRYISQRTGGKNLFFATGTPLANSIAEVFHMQRFLQYDTLRQRGIHQFDAWANTFGQSTADWEMNAAGKFVQKTRFRKFANLPELKGIWGEIADTVTRADLIRDAENQGKRFPLPNISGGRPTNVVTERSQQQASFIGIPRQKTKENGEPMVDENTGQPIMEFAPGTIVYRLENWKQLSKDNPREIPLAITGQARKAGLDYRLIDDNAPDFEGSKINAAVDRIFSIWDKNTHRKGTQLVFCDLSVPAKHKGEATSKAAEKTPTFFVRANEGILHVAGKPLALPSAPDVSFFSYKDGKQWQIIERSTGLKVGTGNTKQDAIDTANAKLAGMDTAALDKLLNGRIIPDEMIDDYIARWEEKQAQAEDTSTEDDNEDTSKEISLDEMLADSGGNFSVYDDIKAKLVARGVPADEIAFIHDFDTDDKKAALFAAVNSGEVRVLLGSTPKMGAGTNVQAKLVALHHMDAPWRPADLEQREGRIIRQGNEFYEADPDGFEIEIYRYATKQTYDSRMWEIIETKARAIEQFKADATLREIEDVSSESANAAEMKAGASGNPLILEEISMRTDLRKLEAQKKAWDRSRFDLEKKIEDAKNKTGWVYNNREFYRDAASKIKAKSDKLGLIIDGKTINDAKELEAKALFGTLMEYGMKNGGVGAKVIEYRGAKIYASVMHAALTLRAVYGDNSVGTTIYGEADKFSVAGFITRMDNLAESAYKALERAESAVETFERDAETAAKELKNGFPKAEALKTLSDKHKVVVAALRAGKTSLDEETQLSRAKAKAAGIAIRDLSAVVARARSSLKNLPTVHVLKSPKGLDLSNPSQRRLYEHIQEAGAANDVEGATHDGEIYLFADNLADEFRAEHVLVNHEVGHYGLREVFGKAGLDPILNTIYMTNAKLRAKADKVREKFGLESNAEATEEVLVEMSPSELIKLNAWRRLVRHIRDWLDSHGFGKLASTIGKLLKSGMSDQQKADLLVSDVVNAARNWVRNGTPSKSSAVSETKLSAPKETMIEENANGQRIHPSAEGVKNFWEWINGIRRAGLDTPSQGSEGRGRVAEIAARTAAAGRFGTQDQLFFDEQGRPRVFYHGTNADITTFDLDHSNKKDHGWLGKGVYLTSDIDTAEGYANLKGSMRNQTVMPVYTYLRNPYLFTAEEKKRLSTVSAEAIAAFTQRAIEQGYDGGVLIAGDGTMEVVAFDNKAVKSAIGNNGDFSGDTADIRFSRSTMGQAIRNLQGKALQFYGNQDLKTFNGLNKSINTQYHKALKDKDFGRVYNLIQSMQNHVATASARPAELAPGVLHRVDNVIDSVKTLVSKSQSRAIERAGMALFDGTLAGDSVMDGKVWTDDQLVGRFGLNETEIALYRQARKAIDASLTELAAAEAYAMAETYLPKTVREDIIESPEDAEALIMGALLRQIDTAARVNLDEETQNSLQDAKEKVEAIFAQAEKLKKAGYAPLMRFGKYDLTVKAIDPDTGNILRDENDNPVTLFYGRFDSQRKLREAERELRQRYADNPDVRFSSGIVNDSANELYRGVTPETLSVFADAVGANQAMDDYIRLVRSERSALKRKLERKGTPGYSGDLQRVLANFITSNARQSSQQLYGTAVNRAIRRIPREKGDVQKEALALRDYVINPDDNGAFGSSIMFAWFLGGSPAAALINMTQPVMMTLPHLSRFGGVAIASRALTKAVPYAVGAKEISNQSLRKALKQASLQGIVDAQEVFHLYATGTRRLASGPRSQALMTLWGSMFSAVEGVNRRLTFIAAWNMANDKGHKDPYRFAVDAVNQTQGIYNKSNRPNWARSSVGRALFTFKTYSIMYVELMHRMWKSGADGKKAVLLMMAIMLLAAGEEGLPGAKALDDIIDTIGQWMGYDTNMRRWKRRHAYELLGQVAGDIALYGVSSMLPLDFGGRLGLGNIIPGTDILKPSNNFNPTRALAELIGPTAGAAQQVVDAAEAMDEGNYGQAAINLMPKAGRDLANAVGMAKRGYARDAAGRKTVDTTNIDAASKAIGFNPTVVANKSRASMPAQQDIQLVKKREADIVHQWAQAVVDGDDKGARAAESRLKEWNRDNPSNPIRITPDQIHNRVRLLKTDKGSRITKTAPKEVRGRIGLELMKQ